MAHLEREISPYWSADSKTSVGFVLALALIALVGTIAYFSTRSFIDTNQAVVDTHVVLQQLEDTLSAIVDAETGQRGYILTGDESYLEPYTAAVSQIDEQIERLRLLTADNPTQQHHLVAFAVLASERLDSIERTLQIYREQGFEAAQRMIGAGSGKQIMDQIRLSIAEMKEHENRLLETRSTQSTERAQAAVGVLLLIIAMLFGLICFIYYLIQRDIIGRKRVEQTLVAERSLLRSVIDTVPDSIYVKDTAGRFVLLNLPQAHLMGAAAPKAVIGTTDFDWFPQELAARYAADERAVVKTGQPLINREEPTVDSTGKHMVVLTTKIPLQNGQGEVFQIVGITRDITERKRAEREILQLNNDLQKRTHQLEVANKELEAFTYSVSHDLRAPLRAIDGFSGILVAKYSASLSEDATRYLQKVRNNAQKMGNLIDDLLAFSRLSRQPIRKQSLMLADLIRQVLNEDLRSAQQNRQIEIVIGDLPPCQADPVLMKQVLINLLDNALKFTQKCETTRIEIGAEPHGEETAYFIKDNGAGFDMQYAHKLFGVFQRLHREEDYPGTGVGLAIVERIIHRHGGRVWAEATVNEGATFYFTVDEDPSEEPGKSV